ncbi:phosphoribosylglycinamide formyltransferase [Thetidibacter halocola]|uniref:Phosphoribosylglycinamide formyltransferase n=1 Tax=Thetidibacter halocola TaxID=2827239 RepID=A0A8J7W9Q2_9RHOB|nr:phosphoribosylglycinamide formyltransferase [Thetidibacter halocola]MBS0122802.1 phosphoribosylglycinamide formyltransferase [Thetidibacter halocola]
MRRVAILISGGGSNMVALARDMTGDHPARPCVVLANSDDAGGLARARALGVPTEVVDHRPFKGDRVGFEDALQAALAPHEPDLICLAGFMRVLTAHFVTPWAGRMLNIHPSLLPKYRGLHTHARALAAGDTEAGCTVHEVTPALDDGPILGQARVPILPGDTPETLAARVLEQEHILYPAVLRRFAAGDRTAVLLP